MPLKLSTRSDIFSFRALDLLKEVNAREAAGENIVRMGAGQPCFGAPDAALQYAKEMINADPKQGYTDAVGMALLRDRIAVYYRDTYGKDIDYSRVVITAGSSAAFVLAFCASFETGDTIALTTPTYPAYRNILKACGLNVVELEVGKDTDYQPTAAFLEENCKNIDGIIIESPANPTGEIIDANELKKICEWCDTNGVRLISDEAYHGITYGEKAQTALKFSDNVIVLNTFSKYFAMTGWRLGWLVVPENMIDPMKKLAESLFVAPPTISQEVAYRVFDCQDVLNDYVSQYKNNRDLLIKELPKAGIENLSAAKGAFYFYADISNLTNDSEQFCARMLDEAKVACTAGMDFDLARGHTTMRISYAGSEADMLEGCTRLQKWLA